MSAVPVSQTVPTNLTHPSSRIRRLVRLLGRTLLAMVNLYSVGLLIYFALRLLFGEGLGIVGLVNSLIAPLLIPSLALLPLCLLFRRRPQVVMLTPSALAFMLLFGGFYLPRPVSVPPDAPQFSLLTYNLHADTRNLDSAVTLVREANADIVAFQEFNDLAAAKFATEFAESYPYQSLHPEGLTVIGMGIISRFPLTADDYWRRPDSLGSQRVQFDLDGATITLYNVHPPVPRMAGGFSMLRRSEEIADLLQRAGQESGMTLLVGDYNMGDQSDDYQHITAQYQDSYREVGWGLGMTYPHLDFLSRVMTLLPPLVRLDYVFHTDEITAIEARTWPVTGGSDHAPLWVKLAAGR